MDPAPKVREGAPRLQVHFEQVVRPRLIKAFGLTNPNQVQTKLKRGVYQAAAGLAGAGAAGIALGPVPLPVKAGYNVIVYAWGVPQSVGGAGVQVAVQYVKLAAPQRR